MAAGSKVAAHLDARRPAVPSYCGVHARVVDVFRSSCGSVNPAVLLALSVTL